MQLRSRTAGFVRTEGGLLPADLLERVRALDPKLPGIDGAAYGLAKNERFGDAIARSWNKLTGAWATFSDELAKQPESDPATTTTRERFLLPLFEELGYGRLSPAKAIELEGKAYPVSHAYETVPIHLVGANVPLDRRSKGVAGAAGQSPHGLLQELLNRSPERLWGIVSNGRTLRILRDNASLVRQAYVEFDLEAIFTAESYADFALLWHIAHRTRLEPRIADGADEGSPPSQANCYLERWSKVAEETGARARDRLRDGVQEAIEALGSGFLAQPVNSALKTKLESGELATQDYYRELLRLVYRLILLFVAEDRDLLLDPKAAPEIRDRYARYYSTARLRQLAERRKGTRHTDLYAGLAVVIGALGNDEGAPAIGLPPLGGFLFGSEACPHLDHAELTNGDLLEAIRKLTTIEERGVLRTVDYRNLGSEELGSIYESLLEYHPEIDTAAGHFKLGTAAGHERKTTGSYYTPSSLISVLLDSALDPVLAEAADKKTKEEAEKAILGLSVVDPAAGSGHFLVAAAHRIAKRLAQVRTEDEEPAPSAIHTALRDVIGHCLYAVDINPMAVELCKVSLWLEALEPGKPLTFLDHHIKCGNSLLGTTPELVAQGIPDAAYDPIEGDDKAVARALKARNKAEREGQLSLGEAGLELPIAELASALTVIDTLEDDHLGAIETKASRLKLVLEGSAFRRAKLLSDAWCGAFLSPKTDSGSAITASTLRGLAAQPPAVTQDLRVESERLAAEYRLFHWQVAFPDVFAARGGFDVAIGNPPWERVKLQDRDYFGERSPAIANATNATARQKLVRALRSDDPDLWLGYQNEVRRSNRESTFLRRSGRYPLTGRGDVNTYAVFAETFASLLQPRGLAGFIAPTGLVTDDTTKLFFQAIITTKALVSVLDFENKQKIFPTVAPVMKFCLVTMGSGAIPMRERVDFVFFAHTLADLGDSARRFTLTADDLALLNPNTRTCPIFRSRSDAELTKAIHRRLPVLINESGDAPVNPWKVSFTTMFHMANDSHLFRTREQLESSGSLLDGNVFRRGQDAHLPLYEAKLFNQFNHRAGDFDGVPASVRFKVKAATNSLSLAELRNPSRLTIPRYWVAADQVHRAAPSEAQWLVAFRDMTNVMTNSRNAVFSVLPFAAVGHSAPLVRIPSARLAAMFLATVNSLPFDYLCRQKLAGAHLTYFILKQLPSVEPQSFVGLHREWLSPSVEEWIIDRAVQLTYTSWDVRPFANECGYDGSPFEWNQDRRAAIRAELDAAFFHLFLGGAEEWRRNSTQELLDALPTPRDAVEHILDTFTMVRRSDEKLFGQYQTKRVVLENYDAMVNAIAGDRPYSTRVEPSRVEG